MTVDGNRLPKYARVAAAVRGQIADGTLRPGQPAPSGAALSRITGYSTLTCRRALRVLVADGVLTPGPSRNARPRVAGPAQLPAERDLAAAARALSAGLAARRRANGLTQPELAGRVGVSVTTIGHAETGRLWQSREFWEHADALLDAGGDLLARHDAYRAASASSAADTADDAETAAAGAASAGQEDVAPGAPPPNGQAAEPCGCLAGVHRDANAAAQGQAVPACVMIMWGDGTVTTVRPPDTAPAETPLAHGTSPGAASPGRGLRG
jgi:DNA-binding transcriptional regulator YhcF (GntR family)/transcriptional regulator with XRE-family HTH domain